ncbi:AAA family ATPase [Flavobacterium sp. LS1P3]|uniref:AAA family ATPase n=1 Tax=Flavobacterium sp. LS1P3 TaxID=3401720 RepID=UPI003AAD5808
MKPSWADEKVYSLFTEFIQKTVLTNDSFLTDEKVVITLTAIDDCIERFIVKLMDGKESFDEKIKQQFANAPYETVLTFAHMNWLWCMSPSDFLTSTKKSVPANILGTSKRVELRDDIYPSGGFGDAGPSIKFRKHGEISFLLLLVKQLKVKVEEGIITDLNSANDWVEKICLECRYNIDSQKSNVIQQDIWDLVERGKKGMYNIMLHLCKPDLYEPIASDGHKDKIRGAFREFIDEATQDVKEANRDQQIFYIRGKVTEIIKDKQFTFYDGRIGNIWGYNGTANKYEYDFDPLSALQYKKAVVLYGPPGTSKTHSAKSIAINAIMRHHLPKCSLKEYLKIIIDDSKINEIVENRIHRLQLHTNYNYEDFVAGMRIVEGKTIFEKGDLLRLIEDIVEKDEYPNVLILDEINRVDLSRLFGEFFSAIENRNDVIKTAVGGFTMKVPENLLVIGTMNEIDFSLERVDFALRRRFVWFPFGFNADTLKEMIREKQGSMIFKVNADDLSRFIHNCDVLNMEIEKTDELGSQYHIGHTFFAEIVEIFNQFSAIQGIVTKSIFIKNGPVKVLWDISIKPMLEAFLGNMDKQGRQEKINGLENIFVHG